MGIFDGVLDWAADKVQTITGEKERIQLVSDLENYYIEFKENVEKLVVVLNEAVTNFNEKVKQLNGLRKCIVGRNIVKLSVFLKRFGKVKDFGEYCREEEKQIEGLPQQQFDKVEHYISEVDWSKDDVFMDTFFLSLKKEELIKFLSEQTAELDEFDDPLVRRLIDQVIIHENGRFTVEFKSGTSVEI